MTSLQTRERAARDARNEFSKTFSEIKERTQFPGIVSEAASLFNWRGKSMPLLIAGTAASATWIVGKLIKKRKTRTLGALKQSTLK